MKDLSATDGGDLSPIDLDSAPRVGGHEGLLRCVASGRVYKPILDWRGECERSFYELVSKTTTTADFSSLLPHFYGVWRGKDGRGAWIVLSDLTAGAARPCCMDIKLGSQTFAPDAGVIKAAREAAKAGSTAALGFRVTGFLSADGVRAGRGDRASVTFVAAHAPFAAFFADRVPAVALASLILRLIQIRKWALDSQYAFFGVSLLLSYDADAPDVSVRAILIDFAHVWGRGGRLRADNDNNDDKDANAENEVDVGDDKDDADAGKRAAIKEDLARGLTNVIACVEHLRALAEGESSARLCLVDQQTPMMMMPWLEGKKGGGGGAL